MTKKKFCGNQNSHKNRYIHLCIQFRPNSFQNDPLQAEPPQDELQAFQVGTHWALQRPLPQASAIVTGMAPIHLPMFRSNQSYYDSPDPRCFQTEPPATRLLVLLFGLFIWGGRLKLGLHGISTVRYGLRREVKLGGPAPPLHP